jgi:hypothetical protein
VRCKNVDLFTCGFVSFFFACVLDLEHTCLWILFMVSSPPYLASPVSPSRHLCSPHFIFCVVCVFFFARVHWWRKESCGEMLVGCCRWGSARMHALLFCSLDSFSFSIPSVPHSSPCFPSNSSARSCANDYKKKPQQQQTSKQTAE